MRIFNVLYVYTARRLNKKIYSSLFKTYSTSWQGRIIAAPTALAAVGEYTRVSGRMTPLPDWIMSGGW